MLLFAAGCSPPPSGTPSLDIVTYLYFCISKQEISASIANTAATSVTSNTPAEPPAIDNHLACIGHEAKRLFFAIASKSKKANAE